ncbi:hypothetical protein KUTeg_014145 [Tegillarca granosa]|uniref:Uncharacterized protein n=1 Tax=Tegillarca granosa TaxID=220873 RepID=A0ABQ9EY96_TEGGR|nr:hypothetical protein KUTeg_014145 [Tegillarca granosa]
MKFDPERFLDNDGHILPHDSEPMRNLLPFGLGKRSCIGEDENNPLAPFDPADMRPGISRIPGESRGSYGTGSQYSESTVINQDITDPDLFPSELGYKGTGYQPKVVGLKSPSITPKPKDPDDHVQLHGPIQPTYKHLKILM